MIYLVFNEGYAASSGGFADAARPLGARRSGLRGLVVEPLPEPKVIGLLALMLLQESRRSACATPAGELVLLENQDRSLWNQDQIAGREAR